MNSRHSFNTISSIRLKCFPRFLFCIILITLSACGYRFSGSGTFPGGVKRIAMGVFENRSGETGVEGIIANDIVYELTRSGKEITYGSENAEAILSGAVTGVITQSVSRKSVHSVAERRVLVYISLKLTDLEGEVIWQVSGLTENEEYPVAHDKGTTEINKREAIIKLSSRLAEKVYYRMTDDF